MMKKFLSLFLILTMLFTLAACEEAVELLNDAADAASQVDQMADDAESLLTQADDLLSGNAEPETTEAPTTEAPTTEEPTTEAQIIPVTEETPVEIIPMLDENGVYTSKDDVALYLHLYGRLPQNFITKAEARALGWEGGSLEPYAPGKCIGGDRFGNYEELLPTDREYHECDIDTLGARSRGAKRLVYSDDGLIYYTDDHYESFVLLYGEP